MTLKRNYSKAKPPKVKFIENLPASTKSINSIFLNNLQDEPIC